MVNVMINVIFTEFGWAAQSRLSLLSENGNFTNKNTSASCLCGYSGINVLRYESIPKKSANRSLVSLLVKSY